MGTSLAVCFDCSALQSLVCTHILLLTNMRKQENEDMAKGRAWATGLALNKSWMLSST